MAKYRVWHGGNNGDGSDWTNAKTTTAAAIALATANGDSILVERTHTGDNALAVDTTWTILNNISIVSVDKDNSDAPTPMGTEAWIGSSSVSIALTIAGAYRLRLSGITLRNGGSTNKSLNIAGTSDGAAYDLDNCYLWLGTTSSAAPSIISGATSGSYNTHVRFKDCTFRFGNAAQTLLATGTVEYIGCSIASAGSIPTTLFGDPLRGIVARFHGCDLSALGSGTLVGNQVSYANEVFFSQCKLGTNYVARATPSSPANASNGRTWILDCASGDTHGLFGYYDGQGALTSDTGVYVTSGAAQQSWKVVTTSGNGPERPFCTPWVSLYHTGASSITPYFDVLRDDSTTAYKDTELRAEFMAKTAGGSPISTMYSDAGAFLSAGTNQASSSLGAGDWTGESGTNWYGKCDSGSAFTPAENGEILGRICFAVPSATIRIDPKIKF
ncbi:hypothetical protein [Candidatus Accumulibacter vicinus]|uniref:Uncharacterized protein n=1 Tax=Candidatus Accumulibacter vicinus TaxID=2954382 RepID=A0A084Y2I8_9PROT|nr:hypothetical protein [Candidatus Accumulibacter vicinus]KFB68932.1 MAG: hypothetical protein CAPSK01_001787 [Candidatus Accumulibacter vicinus]